MTLPLVIVAFIFANHFNIVGMGKDFSKNLGVNYNGTEISFENIGVDADIDTSAHGNEASFEFVLDKNPDYIFTMDRDAAIGTNGAQLAAEVLDNELINQTDASKNGNVVVLEHPNVWYTAEGGITALGIMLSDLENALLK